MNESIREVYDTVEREVDRMRLLVHMHASEYEALFLYLKEHGRPDGYDGTFASLGVTRDQLNGLIVQFHLGEKESFRAADPVINFLLDRGWTENGNSEDAGWGYRQFSFRKIEKDPPMFWPSHKEWKPYELTATVRIWPHPSSQVCKKVEDGQEAKYKFVCEAGA